MAKVDGSLGSMIQGVSQQPVRARRPGQSEEQLNIRNDEVVGLVRRSGTELLTELAGLPGDTDLSTKLTGFVDDGQGENLFYYASDGQLMLFTDTGNAVATLADAYLPSDPSDLLVVKNVGQRLFVINKAIVPAMDGTTTVDAADDLGWVIFSRGGATATEFSIKLHDDTIGELEIWMETSDVQQEEITVSWIMAQLAGLLEIGSTVTPGSLAKLRVNGVEDTVGARAHFAANYTGALLDDHLLLQANDNSLNPRITVYDGTGTKLLQAVNNSIKEVGFLPTRARKNQVVQITGDKSSEDDYYLRFETGTASATGTFESSDGVWKETAKSGVNTRILRSTMPHEIVPAGPTYALQEVEWSDMDAGDLDSNPNPKFIGEPIQDILEFQERLVLLHGQSVSMSQTETLENFFLQSATGTLPDDTIHVQPSSSVRSNAMTYAVPVNRDLVLFATNNAQYTLSGRNKVTPSTVAIPLTAEFSTSLALRPQAAGNNLFYADTVGAFTEVSEMYLLGQEEAHERRSVSNHVPQYIPANVNRMLALDGHGLMLMWDNTTDDQEICLYEYLWQDRQRVQSAWSKWQFHDRLLSAEIVDNEIIMAFALRDSYFGIYLAKMRLDRARHAGAGIELHLDNRRDWNFKSPSILDTQVDLPNLREGYEYKAVYVEETAGVTATMTLVQDNGDGTSTWQLPGDESVTIGSTYVSRLKPSMPVIKDRAGVARAKSDLTVSRFLIDTTETGPFYMIRETSYEVEADYWTHQWEGRTWDDPDFDPDAAPVDDTLVEFTFEENAATSSLVIWTDDYTPLNITDIEWVGSLRGRSTRVNTGG